MHTLYPDDPLQRSADYIAQLQRSKERLGCILMTFFRGAWEGCLQSVQVSHYSVANQNTVSHSPTALTACTGSPRSVQDYYLPFPIIFPIIFRSFSRSFPDHFPIFFRSLSTVEDSHPVPYCGARCTSTDLYSINLVFLYARLSSLAPTAHSNRVCARLRRLCFNFAWIQSISKETTRDA